MKKAFRIQYSVFGLICLLVFAGRMPALAVDLITATVTVTNTAGVTNLSTLTVNGDTRTWTTNVTTPATQIATNNSDLKAATNLFLAIAAAPFNGLTLSRSSSNGIALRGTPGGALSVSLSAGWGTVSLSTNTLTAAVAVRVPYTVESAAQRTNVASGLVAAIGGPESTNVISESSPAFANLVGLGNAQKVTGVKTFVSPILKDPTFTNAINFGFALSSRNASGGEQFGYGAFASGGAAVALGNSATASGPSSTSIGSVSSAQADSATAVGTGANATAPGSSAFGQGSTAAYTNSTAIGYNAAATAANQVMLGSAGVSVSVNNALAVGAGAEISGDLAVGGHINAFTAAGRNNFPSTSDISFGRYALTSLANGNNAAVPAGTNVFVEVSGPTAAFAINGIAGARDGKFLILLNQTTNNMTIAHDSGVDPTATNRIYTMTGADRATTAAGAAMLIYSGAASRWILISLDQ